MKPETMPAPLADSLLACKDPLLREVGQAMLDGSYDTAWDYGFVDPDAPTKVEPVHTQVDISARRAASRITGVALDFLPARPAS